MNGAVYEELDVLQYKAAITNDGDTAASGVTFKVRFWPRDLAYKVSAPATSTGGGLTIGSCTVTDETDPEYTDYKVVTCPFTGTLTAGGTATVTVPMTILQGSYAANGDDLFTDFIADSTDVGVSPIERYEGTAVTDLPDITCTGGEATDFDDVAYYFDGAHRSVSEFNAGSGYFDQVLSCSYPGDDQLDIDVIEGDETHLTVTPDPSGTGKGSLRWSPGAFPISVGVNNFYTIVLKADNGMTLTTAVAFGVYEVKDFSVTASGPTAQAIAAGGTQVTYTAVLKNDGPQANQGAHAYWSFGKTAKFVGATADGVAVSCSAPEEDEPRFLGTNCTTTTPVPLGATRTYTATFLLAPGQQGLTLPSALAVRVHGNARSDSFFSEDFTDNNYVAMTTQLSAAAVTPPVTTCPAGTTGTHPNCLTPIQKLQEDLGSLLEGLLGLKDVVVKSLPQLQFAGVTAVQPASNNAGATVTKTGVAPLAALQCTKACTFETTFTVTLGSKGKAKKAKAGTMTLKAQKLKLAAGKSGVIKATFTKAQLKALKVYKAPKMAVKVTYISGKTKKTKTLTYKLKFSSK